MIENDANLPTGRTQATVEAALAALAILAALLMLFGMLLSPAVFSYGTDTVAHDYPCLRWAWDETLRAGRLALWCPYLFCGIPTLGSALFCPFYPTQWLFAIAPFATAFTLQYLLAFWWAGVGAYALARATGCRFVGALVAGLAFGLAGHVVSLTYAGHMQKALAIAWLPWAMAGWAAMAQSASLRRRTAGALLAGVSVAMQLLASHPQIAYYTVGAGLLLAVALSIETGATGVRRQDRQPQVRSQPRKGCHDEKPVRPTPLAGLTTNALIPYALSLAFAGLLAGAQLLPLFEMSGVSNRAQGVSYTEATRTSFPPWELPEIASPRFSGDSLRGGAGRYYGGWGARAKGDPGERIVSDYAGAGMLVLAIYGLVGAWRIGRLWAALWLIAASMALGKYSPVYWLAFHLAPGVASFRSPGTVMVLMALATAMLAGLGAQRVWDARGADEQSGMDTTDVAGQGQLGRGRSWAGWALAAGAMLCVSAVLAVWPGAAPTGAERSGFAELFAASARRSFLCGGLGCAGAAAVTVLARRCATRIPRRIAMGGLIAVCAVDLVAANRLFVQPEPAEQIEQYLRAKPPDPLLAGRVPPARLVEEGDAILTNRHLLSRIASLHGYHPITYARYHETVESLGGFYDPRALRAFGVEYLIGPAPAGQWPPQGYGLSARPPWNDGARFLYRALEANEFVLARVEQIAVDSAQERTDAEGERRGERGAVVVEGAGVNWEDYAPNRLALTVETPMAGVLVIRDPYAPGWLARVDGEPATLRTAHDFFRRLELSAGAHSVTMNYSPFSFRLGLFLTLTGWAIMAGAAAFALVPSRRVVA